jgi:hypothetical protein
VQPVIYSKMKLNQTLLLAATFALCGQLLAEVPKVENIRASQLDGTKFVEILYDVEDAENDKLTIRVEISADGGERYNVPARTFQGAVGANVDPGKDKKIRWNAGLDWDGEFSDKMRVRITASDGKGLPGLEWSKEIPPGGFLMGQDGGPEGNGPSIHINVNYSYWISKSLVSVSQYVDFLNLAIASEKTNSKAVNRFILSGGNYAEVELLRLGQQIRWSVNKFEVMPALFGRDKELPVRVTLFGAQYFSSFYGLDIPHEIEWEKAMRGPENDDAGEHERHPWGNRSTGIEPWSYVTKYGISDMNEREWTSSPFRVERNAKTLYLINEIYLFQKLFKYRSKHPVVKLNDHVTRQASGDGIFQRHQGNPRFAYHTFRLIRRAAN